MTNYPKQMYNQLLEQTKKSERLERENQALRQEVKRLEHEMSAFTARVEGIIKAQAEEIVRLKAIINKDSGMIALSRRTVRQTAQ